MQDRTVNPFCMGLVGEALGAYAPEQVAAPAWHDDDDALASMSPPGPYQPASLHGRAGHLYLS